MIVTEEEAKTKRCCGPRECGNAVAIWKLLPIKESAADEAFYGHDYFVERMCIGSACMAWRAEHETNSLRIETNSLRIIGGHCGAFGRQTL